jgi:RNA polymerase sigma-70 factor (ECF subfamily)
MDDEYLPTEDTRHFCRGEATVRRRTCPLSSSISARFLSLPFSSKPIDSVPVPAEPNPSQAEESDELLLACVTKGDQQALGVLFQRYRRVLRGIAARILGDGTEAEDLVQDLFVFFHGKSAIFDSSKSSARSWIVQMAYHRAISRRRYLVTRQFYAHKHTEGVVVEQMVGIATTENDYSAEAVFGRNGLEQVMQALSEDQRETLRLHFFEGYTLAEIGKRLGQAHGNVRNHYYRGLAQLRKQMSGSNVRVVEPYGK